MTGFAIKIIALACMITDHLGAVFPDYFPFAFRVIGRVAFPLYAFLIAEGCAKTKNMPKYLLRLGIFAFVSEIPFDLAFSPTRYGRLGVDFFYDMNIFFTLFLGALAVFALQKLKERGAVYALFSVIPLAALMLAAQFFSTDYGAKGVLFIFLLYAATKKIPRLVVMAGFIIYLYGGFLSGALFGGLGFAPYMNLYYAGLLAGALSSVAVAAFYNGRRGPGLKWFFYAAYPVHLMMLAAAYQLMIYFN